MGDAATIQPIAEIFAVAVVAQQLQMMLGRYRTMEAMSELTLSVSSEINGALQTIMGHCDLIERGYPDPNLQRDLATIVRQAQRIAGLLEKMRIAASERLREAEAAVSDAGIPSSPEAFGDRDYSGWTLTVDGREAAPRSMAGLPVPAHRCSQRSRETTNTVKPPASSGRRTSP